MKIAVCGANCPELLKKVERHYKVESVDAKGNIYESAKVTYDYDNEKNVVFNGCVLDYAVNLEDMHLFDEQVIMCSLDNLDVVYVYTAGMSDEEINRYHQFDEFFVGKVIDVRNADALVVK